MLDRYVTQAIQYDCVLNNSDQSIYFEDKGDQWLL